MNDQTPAAAPAALVLDGVRKGYRQPGGVLDILTGASLTLRPGEIVGLLGPSGSGKSTLLHLAGLLDRPDAGTITIAGQRADALGDGARTALRRRTVGFVYQAHHLLPEFDARENVALPQMTAGVPRRAALERADALLAELGLAARARHRPARLSGGEQQRVAMARALANRPALLIADEPTGNLDPATAEGVFAMLLGLRRAHGLAILVATHSLELAARMDRVVELRGGVLHERHREA